MDRDELLKEEVSDGKWGFREGATGCPHPPGTRAWNNWWRGYNSEKALHEAGFVYTPGPIIRNQEAHERLLREDREKER